MSRIPALAEFEVGTKVESSEARRPGITAIVAGAFSRLFREMAMRSAMRRLYRYGAADHRFLGDIGVAPGGVESVVRHGRRRRR